MTTLITIESHIRSAVKSGIIPFRNAAALSHLLDNDGAGLGLFGSAIQLPRAAT
jgi:hypothetical protein